MAFISCLLGMVLVVCGGIMFGSTLSNGSGLPLRFYVSPVESIRKIQLRGILLGLGVTLVGLVLAMSSLWYAGT
jgi:hypothetical protein